MKRASLLVVAAGFLSACGVGEPGVARAERVAEVPATASGTIPEPGSRAASAAEVCRLAETGRPLPAEVRESSGLAQSRRDPALFWTHNDAGNAPDLFAVDASGRLVQRVRVAGAGFVDWEDLESGPCDAGSCLFVADIGDNDARRERITIYRLPEPEPGATESERAVPLHARFPDGPRDAEGLFVLPSGDLYVVTKGRRGPVGLYRYPAPLRPGETVVLERVREIFPEPGNEDDRVTGATASPGGGWVAVRSYRSLYLYPAADLVGGGVAEPRVVDLRPLGEAQGESVAISPDGSVWMTSEAKGRDGLPAWARLRCTLPGA